MTKKPCNYCVHNKLKQRANQEGKRLTVLKNGLRGGLDLFIHPQTVDLVQFRGNEAVLGEHHVVWLEGVLPSKCNCESA